MRLGSETMRYMETQYFPGTASGQKRQGFLDEDLGEPAYNKASLGLHVSRDSFDSCGLFSKMSYNDALDLGIRAEYIEVVITRKPA